MSLKEDYNWGLIIMFAILFVGIGLVSIGDGIKFGETTITTETCDFNSETKEKTNCTFTKEIIP